MSKPNFPVEAIRIGDTLNIFIGSDEVEKTKQIDAAIASGEAVTRNGVMTWRTWSVIHLGTDEYIWDATMNRIKGELVEVIKAADGTITRQKIGTSFRTWDKAWE